MPKTKAPLPKDPSFWAKPHEGITDPDDVIDPADVARQVERATTSNGFEDEVLTRVVNEQHDKSIEDIVAALPTREREVLRLRFGLDRGGPRTLQEVGDHFGLTRERIRQIEAKAIAHLRGHQ